MTLALKEYFSDLFDLFYPNVCAACSQKLLKGESVICLRCEIELPQTDDSFNPDNRLMRRFTGRIELQGAAALYVFHKGGHIQQLLHQLKYRGRKDIGRYMGNLLGNKLKEEGAIIKNIDLILPVPLHWKKFKTRGYNQCDPFAQGLSETLDVPFSANKLLRIHENISQTKKKRFDRWENVAEIFSVSDKHQLAGKHILVVDDVVTTGATAEACMQVVLAIPSTRVSFAAIASAAR